MYFFERLLYRISISQYKNNFILKGGLLLSAMIGDERRTTQDMDTMVKKIELESNILIPIIQEIISMKMDDGIKFTIIKTKDIRQEDMYGGIKIYLMGIKEHLQVPLSIDITTKDPIVPNELIFRYKCMFSNHYIKIMSFSKESIIAEKFETLIKDVNANTRTKDFYDLYMLMYHYYNELNKENLVKAIRETCKRRNSLFLLEEIIERYNEVRESSILSSRWEKYKNKYSYATAITYNDILKEINKIVKLIKEYQDV